MYELAKKIFPLKRTLTDARTTLAELSVDVLVRVFSGTKVFDWTVPREWHCDDPLAIGYSAPGVIESEDQVFRGKDSRPYVTSYYQRRCAVCAGPGDLIIQGHEVKSEFRPGFLNIGETVVPGESDRELLFSTYTCHPQMANDNVSGMVVLSALVDWVREKPRHYTYRFVFNPETIGALAYAWAVDISNVIFGAVVCCCGDERDYSFIPSKYGDTYIDDAARHVLRHHARLWTEYPFTQRGSDERQWNYWFPCVSLMRSKHGTYPEYHTSADDLSIISEDGLMGAFRAYTRLIEIFENDRDPYYAGEGEPFLTRYGLYNTLSRRGSAVDGKKLCDITMYATGVNSILDIAELVDRPFWDVLRDVELLEKCGVLDDQANR